MIIEHHSLDGQWWGCTYQRTTATSKIPLPTPKPSNSKETWYPLTMIKFQLALKRGGLKKIASYGDCQQRDQAPLSLWWDLQKREINLRLKLFLGLEEHKRSACVTGGNCETGEKLLNWQWIGWAITARSAWYGVTMVMREVRDDVYAMGCWWWRRGAKVSKRSSLSSSVLGTFYTLILRNVIGGVGSPRVDKKSEIPKNETRNPFYPPRNPVMTRHPKNEDGSKTKRESNIQDRMFQMIHPQSSPQVCRARAVAMRNHGWFWWVFFQ